MVYICGDGERFGTPEAAILHVSRLFKRAGTVISIEPENPLEAVCARYGVKVPTSDADWKPLALALMKANGQI